MNDLTHLSLFAGIGGIDLAAEWAGFQTVGQVEQNPYANRLLRSRFGRKIHRWTDIRDLSAEDFRRRTGIDSPTLISGGFPCQPFSSAGKRRGKEDDRYLWPEMFRVVRELRPDWVLGENVAGIVNMELESCCSDLESEGYAVRPFLIPACGVGAWHRRERVFIIAHTRNPKGTRHRFISGPILFHTSETTSMARDSLIPNPNGTRLQEPACRGIGGFQREVESSTRGEPGRRAPAAGDYWSVEPAVGRVATGVPHRVDRLRCLGNAVVPQQVYPILAGIAQIENSLQG